ncbi:CPBP family intramembrane metalloprotease [Clostridium sp. YIM B02505]|uniref:CPBP family intramembrane metalloprotease n=1 Tax=Clostridium yunnanense TaxID=2800325 RepID=A0ABS1ERJ2_9CLOT|nr:CPBP family intramembrane glutamic endopeptidase [Clostridium yunnanense]MBK1811960.1 CPBP family intramembrane metalloprotease [Clostridium yunnanense]
MSHIKKFSQAHTYIFSFITALTAIALLYVCNFFLSTSNGRLDYNLNGIITYIVPLIFVFIIYISAVNIKSHSFDKKGIFKGFFLGWPFMCLGLYNIIGLFFSTTPLSSPEVKKVFFFTIIMFLVGTFEEFLCRGIILNSLLNKLNSTKAGLIKAVILSSFIFGLGHLVNLIVSPNLLISTLSQIIYTTLHGILFAAIYLRCKNIWSVVFLHAVYDWLVKASGIFHTVSASGTPVDISFLTGLINILFAIPFALVGLFLLRKVMIADIDKSVLTTKSM